MFGIENYLGFIIAAISIIIIPGHEAIYLITQSITNGKKAGISSVLGVETGCLTHTTLAAFGLVGLFTTSTKTVLFIKYLGAGYIFYLGIKSFLLSSTFDINPKKKILKQTKVLKHYYQGFLLNILNPNVALFFLAFLPGFISKEHLCDPIPFLLLGITFIVLGTVWCLTLVSIAPRVFAFLNKGTKIIMHFGKIRGLIFMLIAIFIAFG